MLVIGHAFLKIMKIIFRHFLFFLENADNCLFVHFKSLLFICHRIKLTQILRNKNIKCLNKINSLVCLKLFAIF